MGAALIATSAAKGHDIYAGGDGFARDAWKTRVTETCGTCAEHGCRDCTCQTRL